jgi:hypothetical protein
MRARLDGGARIHAGHSDPMHGDALVKSKRGGAGNAAYPELGCFNGVVEKVDGELAELWTWWIGFYGSSTCVRAQRSSWLAMARRAEH